MDKSFTDILQNLINEQGKEGFASITAMTNLIKEITALRKDMAAFTQRNGTAAIHGEEEVW